MLGGKDERHLGFWRCEEEKLVRQKKKKQQNCNTKQSMAKVLVLEFVNYLEKCLMTSKCSENVCLFLLHVQLDANGLKMIMHSLLKDNHQLYREGKIGDPIWEHTLLF